MNFKMGLIYLKKKINLILCRDEFSILKSRITCKLITKEQKKKTISFRNKKTGLYTCLS